MAPPPARGAGPGEADAGAALARIQARMAALAAAEAARPAPAAPQGLAGRLAALRQGAAEAAARPAAPDHAALARALPGAAAEGPLGVCWRMDRIWRPEDRHGDRCLDGRLLGRTPRAALLLDEPAGLGFDPRRAVYFDLETTGLAMGQGTLPFLIGALHHGGGGWVLEQWLLRSPDEEPAALLALSQRLAEADWVVSFNGLRFDAPLVSLRCRAHGLPDPFEGLAGHLDLLLPARWLLGEGLPNRKLSTLEVAHLGLRRVDDVPGAKVPARYTGWLASGDPAGLVDVVAHNRDDLLSLLTLLDVLLERAEAAPSLLLRSPKAALRLAKRAEALDPAYAEEIYTVAAALPETASAGRRGLARLERARRA